MAPSHGLGPSYKHQKSISQCCLTIDTMRNYLTLLPPLLESLIYLPGLGEMDHWKLWTKISSFFLVTFAWYFAIAIRKLMQVIELRSEVVAVMNLTVWFVGLWNRSGRRMWVLAAVGKGTI